MAAPLAGKVIVIDPGNNPNNAEHLANIDALRENGAGQVRLRAAPRLRTLP